MYGSTDFMLTVKLEATIAYTQILILILTLILLIIYVSIHIIILILILHNIVLHALAGFSILQGTINFIVIMIHSRKQTNA